MKILMLSWEYPPKNVGGLSNHVYHLAHSLASIGHEIHIITCQEGTAPIKENSNGVLVHRVEPYKIPTDDFVKWIMQLNFAMIEEGIRLIKEEGKFDILHAHDWLSAYSAKTLKWAFNIPIVCTIHATEYGRNNGIKTEMQRYISYVEGNLVYESWRTIVCSNYMREEINRLFSEPWEKIWVIPNGVEVKEFQKSFNKKKFKLRYARENEKVVIYVGRHVFEKGIQVLIDAIPDVIKEYNNIKFVICGMGSMTEELKVKVKNRGLLNNVTFTGYISDIEKKMLYSIADIAVFPSLYEPFGIVALESMAAKCPVIASDVGGFSEIINHRVNGMKFICGCSNSLKDNILEILSDDMLSHNLKENAFKNVIEKYSWTHVALLTIQMYKEVLNQVKGTEWENKV
ncbi:glycosyltransferase family 4 protein [Clostridium botulinum]|uniref:Glycosyl transferase family 1 n=1 Tax=Clostridium botulinum TaxID=1491 RepID=A0A9Q1UY59_CLOBO|nr:glycosyltransferase family 4 protein [Clostridium botulinum]AEB76549.1 glycosyl transferase, group 1 family protein [Clostridium botulinum BKT015925]KEH97426.1 glycosyl transferase family 1 [Clostridium botulinum D str. 16868]KEI04056.1 glycosyl transferase family 1 [Clostridium botulinum C/D str. Sp77]KLU76070.1 glycosyl transferase family 1 [Clostridium botulinum V891]KOA74244.1 glycosyl transferase family 1 [Clostridium botulinum]